MDASDQSFEKSADGLRACFAGSGRGLVWPILPVEPVMPLIGLLVRPEGDGERSIRVVCQSGSSLWTRSAGRFSGRVCTSQLLGRDSGSSAHARLPVGLGALQEVLAAMPVGEDS
jgi:hypothetical protein